MLTTDRPLTVETALAERAEWDGRAEDALKPIFDAYKDAGRPEVAQDEDGAFDHTDASRWAMRQPRLRDNVIRFHRCQARAEAWGDAAERLCDHPEDERDRIDGSAGEWAVLCERCGGVLEAGVE